MVDPPRRARGRRAGRQRAGGVFERGRRHAERRRDPARAPISQRRSFRRSARCGFASVSRWATSSSKASGSTETASTSPPAWRAWPRAAASASRARPTIRWRESSRSATTSWASRPSRTSPDRCACIGSASTPTARSPGGGHRGASTDGWTLLRRSLRPPGAARRRRVGGLALAQGSGTARAGVTRQAVGRRAAVHESQPGPGAGVLQRRGDRGPDHRALESLGSLRHCAQFRLHLQGQGGEGGRVARDLGVRYVLEGGIQRAGSRVRITAQLVDATTGYHVWAERYDREVRDIFALQDEVTREIVRALAVRLTEGEQRRMGRAPTADLEAYDLVFRGQDERKRTTREANMEARRLFVKALDLDPDYARAYAGLSWAHLQSWQFLWSTDPESLERARGLAERAIALDDTLAEGSLPPRPDLSVEEGPRPGDRRGGAGRRHRPQRRRRVRDPRRGARVGGPRRGQHPVHPAGHAPEPTLSLLLSVDPRARLLRRPAQPGRRGRLSTRSCSRTPISSRPMPTLPRCTSRWAARRKRWRRGGRRGS